jgi:hypothetical protein
MKSKMNAHEEFITSKLNQKRFKTRIYSSREISQLIGMECHPANKSGSMKATLTNHPDWLFQYGRSWLYIGNSQTKPIKSNPLPEKRAPQRKEISILWGLIRIK